MGQWVGLHLPSPSSAGSVGLILGWEPKIPHASPPRNQNMKQKQYCKKFNKDFKKNGPHQKKLTNKKRDIGGDIVI